MNAAEATRKAREARKTSFEDVLSDLKKELMNAVKKGQPALNINIADGFRRNIYLERIVAHFENLDYSVFVDGDYLTVYWGLEDSEIEEQ